MRQGYAHNDVREISPLALAQVSDLWPRLKESFRGHGTSMDLLILL